MDPLSELQDDLTLDDTSQALNQLKLASIDEKNWPSDEMPDFPKSGGRHNVSGNCRHHREEAPSCWRGFQGVRLGQDDQPRVGQEHKFTGGRPESMSHGEGASLAPRVTLPLPYSSDDSKSSSPEPVTHLKWDDPYYDIARHQIVEVAGEHAQCCISSLIFCAPGLEKPASFATRKGTFCAYFLVCS